MKKFLLIFFIITSLYFLLAKSVSAASCDISTIPSVITIGDTSAGATVQGFKSKTGKLMGNITINATIPSTATQSTDLKIRYRVSGIWVNVQNQTRSKDTLSGKVTIPVGTTAVKIVRGNNQDICTPVTITAELHESAEPLGKCSIDISWPRTINDSITISVDTSTLNLKEAQLLVKRCKNCPTISPIAEIVIKPNTGIQSLTISPGTLDVGHTYYAVVMSTALFGKTICGPEAFEIYTTEEEQPLPGITFTEFDLCKQAGDNSTQCEGCLAQDKIWTAIGCLSFSPKDFISDLLPIAISLAGGIALLLMLYGVVVVTTSGGNPENVQRGKEIITGAIAGLLFIIFSMVLLNLIGVKILEIPGF